MLANVDEVFVDLCRQMLRKDDTMDRGAEDDYYQKYEDPSSARKKKSKRRKRSEHRCVIL